ncbi:DUF6221 family protein [Streptomyces sp. MPA0124]|uniref:DUF6221 family protein n=1 Tax=Streptomyces sp. MPA0124 TaxID=3378069 RepID=UPI0038548878
MDDLLQWLRAQLDDDERTARAATPGPWEWRHEYGEPWQPVADGWLDYSGEHISAPGDRATLFGPGMTPHADAVHIATHDPARVLREIDAKRQQFAACVDYLHDSDEGVDPLAATILRLLALPYADRPGYRDEWRP